MQPFHSTTTLHKYFPDLSLAKDATLLAKPPQDLFCTPFSISNLVSTILQWSHSEKTRSFVELDCFTNATKYITCEVRDPATLQFARITRSGNLGASFTNGDEEVLQAEERNCEEDLDSEARKARGRNSWNDMPKFLLAGTVSTVISRTCIAPLERIKLECIIEGTKRTWFKVVQWIWVSEGLRGFWKGNMLNLFRMVPFKSINFICFDMYLDGLLSIPGKKDITNHDRLIGGGISGFTATVICLPLDTIRTRLVAPGGEALGGVVGCFLHMVQNEGFSSLYKGLAPALISMGPASAVFYAVYDILKTSHLSRSSSNNNNVRSGGDGNELGVVRTLIYGAIAGVCAETVTYPLEVIRRQLQLQKSTKLGLVSAFIKLVERDGVGSLFAGLVPSTLQVLPSASLSYLFYEMMKSILKIN